MIKIAINEIVFYGYHGVLPAEQALGQEFRVDLEMMVKLPGQFDDNIKETLDYRVAVEAVRRVLTGKPRRLLETLVREIASELMALPGISGVRVSVSKPHPPVPSVRGGVTATICIGEGL